ncbi:M48 family metalloprotease [Thiohalorhabdus sp.]|uniref:M48 family metalloprotease n=1 Tax=Thiohalorhabdus sp. TaxID=3094134 RepID=UPI002FC2EF92
MAPLRFCPAWGARDGRLPPHRSRQCLFTGLGSAKRVVLFDTLLDSLDRAQTEAVLAHELGHFRLGHIRNGMMVAVAAALAGLGLLAWLSNQPWFFTGLEVEGPSAVAAVILFVLVGPVFAFPLKPVASAWSRRREFAADRFAQRYSDAAGLSRALRKLYRDNAIALTADPVYARVYHSHPLPAERIARRDRGR